MEEETPGPFFGFTKPYLRLYEEEEETFIFGYNPLSLFEGEPDEIYHRPVKVTLHADESQSGWSDVDAYRHYHVRRFFESLEGFYTGNLDLMGRHLHRFMKLSTTLARFSDDLKAIRKTVKVEHYEEENLGGKVKTLVKHVMTDGKLWEGFRLKWKVPRIVDFPCIENHMEKLATVVLKAKGVHKIQQLCIMDLPLELINYIFSLATLQDASLLASTCKVMKNIGASRLNSTRFVELRFPKVEYLKMILENLEQGLDEFANEQSRKIAQYVDFLVSRPGLADAIQNLTLSDYWEMECRVFPVIRPHARSKAYYDPINTSLNTLLVSCRGLTHLSITLFALSSDWLRTMAQLPKLRSLVFHSPWIDLESVEDDILNRRIPSSPQVRNLLWRELRGGDDLPPSREFNGQGLWYTLLLFPNLRTFNHTPSHVMGAMRLPSPDIQDRCNHFCQGFRRVSLGLTRVLVPSLTGWINSSQLRTLTPCTLTHFKLRTDLPLPDDLAIPLLESLHSAPLKVLVLEGIKDGSLRLLERIVQLFPDLIGLTLIRRENQWQRQTKLATWPHQTGEYASRMDGFRKLKYFGWNFRVPEFDITPFDLLFLEAIALRDAGHIEPDLSWNSEYRDGMNFAYLQDASSIVLPFARFCPTLEMMGLEHKICRCFIISRGANGEISVSSRYRFRRWEGTQHWNPSASDMVGPVADSVRAGS